MPSSRDIKAGGAYLELGLRPALDRGLKAAQAKLRAFSRGTAVFGGALLGGSAAIVAPILAATSSFAEAGAMLKKTSIQTGESVENLSALQFAAQQTGVDFDDLVGAIEESNIRMGESIRDGAGALHDTLTQMGVDTAALAELSPADRFRELAGILQETDDVAKRGFLADEMFGGDAFKVLPLLESDLDSLMQQAEQLGVVMSTSAAEDAAAYKRELSTLHKQLGAVTKQAGSALAPVLTKLLKHTQPLLTIAIKWIKQNKGLIVTIVKIAALVGAAGAVLLVLSAVASGLASGIGFAAGAVGMLGAVLGFVLSPAGLVIAALLAAGYAFFTFTDAGRSAASGIAAGFAQIMDIVGPAADGIMAALSVGDLSTAGAIAMETLYLIFVKGMGAIANLMQGVLGDTIGTITTQLLQGDLAGAWITTVNLLNTIWAGFVQGLFEFFEPWIDKIVDKWESMTGSFASRITDLNLFGEQATGQQGIELDQQLAGSLRKQIDQQLSDARDASAQGDTATSERALAAAADLAESLAKVESTLGRGALDEIKQASKEILGGQADSVRSSVDEFGDGLRKQTAEAFEDLKKQTEGGTSKLDAEIAASEARLQELIAAAKAKSAAAYADLPTREGTAASLSATVVTSGYAAAFLQAGGGPQERMLKASEETARNTREIAEHRGDATLS